MKKRVCRRTQRNYCCQRRQKRLLWLKERPHLEKERRRKKLYSEKEKEKRLCLEKAKRKSYYLGSHLLCVSKIAKMRLKWHKKPQKRKRRKKRKEDSYLRAPARKK